MQLHIIIIMLVETVKCWWLLKINPGIFFGGSISPRLPKLRHMRFIFITTSISPSLLHTILQEYTYQ